MMRSSDGRALSAIVACLLANACGGSSNDVVDAATDASLVCADDCASYRCDDQRGRCFRTCVDGDQCSDGFACVDLACIGTECTVETAVQRCGAYACVNGTCATNCAIAPCSEGFYCRADLNVCAPRCTRPGDPVCEGFLCDVSVGECESYCFAGELECAAGYSCVDNQCT